MLSTTHITAKSYFLEDRLYRLLPKRKAELLLTARQSMQRNKSNITIKQRHDAIRRELQPLLMEVKKKLKADIEKLEKENIGKHGFVRGEGCNGEIDNKKRDISAINVYLYY